MPKKKKHAEEHENLERWLVSYADFITLLFATFVVLYALSQIDLAKFKELKISIQKAFSSQSVLQGSESVMDKASNSIVSDGGSPETSMVETFFDNIKAKMEENSFNNAKKSIDELNNNAENDGIETKVDERGLIITLVDSLFFTSGSAELKKTAYSSLLKIGSLLEKKFPDHSIRIEGHTDNLSIKSAIYPSNWELSSARASSVVRFMTGNLKFLKTRFSAVGYADTVPVASNLTEEGRNKNRRVEIVVLRNNLNKSEPKPVLDQLTNPKPTVKKTVSPLDTLSPAAKELINKTGQSPQNVIHYKDASAKDSYDIENTKIEKDLHLQEQKN